MRSLLRAARRMWPLPSAPRQFPTSNFELIDSSRRIEEETLPWYNPLEFYPVKIGEVFQSRYQVTGKLGYGMNGTVWLCRDLMWREYVTLKIGTSQALQNEVEVLKHLRSIKTTHAGAGLVRQLLDDFAVSKEGRTYHGIIQAPLSATLESLRMLLPDRALPLELLQAVLSRLLLALDFLHCEAQVIHTDIQAKNVLFGLDSSRSADDVCSAFEKREFECPSPRKYVDGRVIHTSRRLVPPIYQYGEPILSDFGEARFGECDATVTIQPSPYRAPEVLLGIPFTPMVDIWNIGVMIPNLLGKGHLFKRTGGPDNEESDAYHLAHMVSLLGSPPTEFLRRTKTGRSWDVFHEDGSWKGKETIPAITLEDVVADWDVGNKVEFLRFLRKMLQWEPENRSSPKQLLEDPWLNFVGAKA